MNEGNVQLSTLKLQERLFYVLKEGFFFLVHTSIHAVVHMKMTP